MKKLIPLLIAITLFTACGSPAVQPDGMQSLNLDAPEITMEVPQSFHMEVRRKPNGEPRYYVLFGEEYYTNGDLKPLIRLTAEAGNYDEWMSENWDAPYYPLENSCEVDHPLIGEIFGCEKVSENITSYYQTNKMGDLSAVKKYYFEREDNGSWPQIELWVDLYTDDFKEQLGENPKYESMKTEFAKLQLTAEQKRRIKLVDDIIKNMEY
jgi:hypothetical protein